MCHECIGHLLTSFSLVCLRFQNCSCFLEKLCNSFIRLGPIVCDIGDDCKIVKGRLNVMVRVPSLCPFRIIVIHINFIYVSLQEHSASMCSCLLYGHYIIFIANVPCYLQQHIYSSGSILSKFLLGFPFLISTHYQFSCIIIFEDIFYIR